MDVPALCLSCKTPFKPTTPNCTLRTKSRDGLMEFSIVSPKQHPNIIFSVGDTYLIS